MQLSDKEQDLLNRFGKYISENEISNECLVQFIELCGTFLNLQTISNYAKNNNISYNGVKNNRNIVEIFEVKFVIDND